jgi:hypothetical protein
LPSEVIVRFGFSWTISNTATLGDGSETVFDFYAGTVIWDGQYRQIDIAASETEPLLGMAMLYGYRLQVDNVEGGIVKIEALCVQRRSLPFDQPVSPTFGRDRVLTYYLDDRHVSDSHQTETCDCGSFCGIKR